MLRKLFIIMLLACAGLLQAQQLKVVEFRADLTMTDAVQFPKEDYNGDRCGLIKLGLALPVSDVTFEGDIISSENKAGEWWIYMPKGSNWLTIKSKSNTYLPLRCEFMDYGIKGIQSNVTYVMNVEKPNVGPEPVEVRMQYLAFQITPTNATLEVNDKIWEVEADGSATDYLNFGTYSYRVQAPNYYPESGEVTLDNSSETRIVPVNLKPNFGWIEVPSEGNLKDASVYIDNALVGKAPCKSEALKSGQHTVRIVKKMYKSTTETVTVQDNKTTRFAPTLGADFANVTLMVDADAEIWVNDEKKGVRSWTGPLGNGTYKIECKQASHETTLTTQKITDDMAGKTITLPAPRPIYGSLNVESTPNFCKLFVDGKDMGVTPKAVPELLIGSHQIRLTKDGYADYTETITITKGERKQVKATLSNGKEIQFTCNVPDAQLEIDGQNVGIATGTYQLTYGSHSLKATAADYREYTYTINVTEGGSRSHSITMQALTKDEETFTVNGVSFTMKLVEGGTFQMGATSEQGSEADSDEKPVHSVTLSSYYMGETEVTQALWKAVMGSNPSRFKGDNLPVEQVSWNDCQEFIRKLNQKTGKNFRLPTEAEWEYAARGGKKSKGYKYAGSNTIGSVAWYRDNSGSKTHAVKTKSANELGLYDMLGNVWEWCSDWYGSGYYGKSPSSNPQGPSSGSYRVLRGGSWDSFAGYCRVSNRNISDPGIRIDNRGFRLLCPR